MTSSGPMRSGVSRPRNGGPRTTLRLPEALAAVAQQVAARDGVSRNDAVVRLAELGAAHQQRLDAVAARAEERLTAWRARNRTGTGRLPNADELEVAVAAARRDGKEDE